jgi:hypothetical protein
MIRKASEPMVVVRGLTFLILLIGTAGSLAIATPAVPGAMAAAGSAHGVAGPARHDDDSGDDDDGGGGGNQGDNGDNGKHGKGEKKKQDKNNGNAAAPEPVQVVVVQPATGYRVTVGCQADAAHGQSTCVFAGVALDAGETISGVAVPEGAVCAPVAGGDFARSAGGTTGSSGTNGGETTTWYAVGSGYRGPAYVSKDQPDVLTLVLTGSVTTAGSATYWVRTAKGVAAAAGPGLRCTAAEATSATAVAGATGAIVVQGFACPFQTAPGNAAAFDWFAGCVQPLTSATFEITALDGENAGWQRSETADAGGVLRADGLAPGHYRLVQVGSDWCHAESDRVDDRGNVVVAAGERASVWIFDCAKNSAATPAPASK